MISTRLPIRPFDRALGHRGEFLVRQRDLPGDPHTRVAGLHEGQPGDDIPHRLRCRAARFQRAEILVRLHQDEMIGTGQFAQAAAQQRLPGQRLRMAVQRIRHRLVEALDRRQVRRQVGIALGHAHTQQRQRGEQPARRRVGDKLAQERLRVDGLVHQRRQLLQLQKQQPFLFQERIGVRAAHRQEMRLVGGQPGGEFVGSGVGLLGDAGIDHGDQQVTELREVAVHLHRLLPPGQRRLEQQVGVGADAEMGRRHPGGQNGQQHAGKNHGPGMTAAEIDQTDEQADQHA